MLGLWLNRWWLAPTSIQLVFLYSSSSFIEDALQHGFMHPLCWDTTTLSSLSMKKQRFVTYCCDLPTYSWLQLVLHPGRTFTHDIASLYVCARVLLLRSGRGIRVRIVCLLIVATSGIYFVVRWKYKTICQSGCQWRSLHNDKSIRI